MMSRFPVLVCDGIVCGMMLLRRWLKAFHQTLNQETQTAAAASIRSEEVIHIAIKSDVTVTAEAQHKHHRCAEFSWMSSAERILATLSRRRNPTAQRLRRSSIKAMKPLPE